MAHRARTEELRQGLKAPQAAVPVQKTALVEKAEGEDHDHHVLGSAAEVIGSALGSLAAKVKSVKTPELSHVE